jgi:hypothetical protein
LTSWVKDYGPDLIIDVRVANRPLTETEREKLTIILHSGTAGSWDWKDLSGWDAGQLKEWGFDENLLKGWSNDSNSLRDLLAANYSYTPNITPVIMASHVSDSDITKESARLDGQFTTSPEYIQVICPHCAHEFWINKKDVK